MSLSPRATTQRPGPRDVWIAATARWAGFAAVRGCVKLILEPLTMSADPTKTRRKSKACEVFSWRGLFTQTRSLLGSQILIVHLYFFSGARDSPNSTVRT